MNPDILIPLTMFGGAAVVLWTYFDGRHKERMAMIEKGVNPADFKSAPPSQLRQGSVLSNLKWGLLFAFVGIGIFAGELLHNLVWQGFDTDISIFGSILISGGIALIIFYFIAAKKLKEKQDDKG